MKISSLTSFLSAAGVASLSMLPSGNAFGRTPVLATKTPVAQVVAPVTNDTGTGSTTVATDPVGYTTTALPANSDTLVSIPLTRPAAYTGAIASINGSTITLAGTPGFTASQFVYSGTQANTYYAIVGPLLTSLANPVSVTNGSTTVTGTGLSAIVAGDELLVNGLAYNVASVTDTALVLSRAYTGTTATGLSASYNHSPKEGSYYTVTANGTGSLTVNLNGDTLSMVAAGTSVSLIPYWTLGTAFPAADAGKSFIVSTGTVPRSFQTQILLPDLTSAGINLASSAGYINYNGAWRLVGSDGTLPYDDVILPPTTFLTVRNAGTATTFIPAGGVYMNRVVTPLDTQASVAQDNAVALARPTDVTLNDLGLITSGAFTASTGTVSRFIKDSILVYDNTVVGINKASPTSYYYYNGGWRLTGSDGTADYGTVTIPSGVGFTIRKAVVTNGATSFWQNTRTY